MYEYISGKIAESSPAHVIIDVNGIGYLLHISLNTFSRLDGKKEAQLFIHENIREDAFALYGFADPSERDLFRHLISVSGIGANTARMMLSSLSPEELSGAILTGNVNVIKGVKGIGAKTAQRVIVDLKDKLSKEPVDQKIFATQDNTIREEALSALVMLGFAKASAQKALDKLLAQSPDLKVEDLIKQALKIM
ncbi:Holliday junction branch migration protein RuvA [Carboxylicivirga sediminis]|uniref:Holliday junction branch migration complex subunit RuvA n=1 Tax=Carboxylicivirga sediminis TaxID=2006564 RepID=A0A941IYI9_9BACT|nr:Holliday junction branch migration protein RuvA [Carboxylicivirga sediminis]MBR8537931.1 Holliday junction branch migration protein RuvA [Carboxylicivirga sediminis]